MVAIESEIYFRIPFWWWHSFEKWKSTGIPNFYEISQFTAEIKLLPVSENGLPPFRIFVSGFHFCLIFVIILHWPTKFRQNRTTLGGVMTSYRFPKMVAGSHIGFDLDKITPPTKCNCWSKVGPQFGFDRIYSFGDNGISIFAVLAWNCLFTPILEVLGHILPNDVTHRPNL